MKTPIADRAEAPKVHETENDISEKTPVGTERLDEPAAGVRGGSANADEAGPCSVAATQFIHESGLHPIAMTPLARATLEAGGVPPISTFDFCRTSAETKYKERMNYYVIYSRDAYGL